MSEYRELVKSFEKIRAYMRDFYVYGFRSREEFTAKSARSYDDEKRRIESWLGDYMSFVRTASGKNMFISIDSRSCVHNPFYKAWKAKSFTDGDITLHFILFDILSSADKCYTLNEITDIMDKEYLSCFENPMMFDESTVRKKLKEYCSEGIVTAEKQGRKTIYRRAETTELPTQRDAIEFFTEVAPCGVVGSFILDKMPRLESIFGFKHHYMTNALDSGVLASLFDAMGKKCSVTVLNHAKGKSEARENRIVPLKIFISVQSGRQYLIAYQPAFNKIKSFRCDYLSDVKICEPVPRFDELRERLSEIQSKMWGIQTEAPKKCKNGSEMVEFTVRASESEPYIVARLMREKRCGTVTKIGEDSYRFSAEVCDSNELLTWMRSFICRITDVSISNREVERRFKDDLEAMYKMYGINSEGEVEQ